MNINNIKYGLGCIKSELDGTEYKLSLPENIKLPEEYTYIDTMPPVLDQGPTSQCVCYSVTSVMDWKANENRNTNQSCGFDIDGLYSKRKDLTQNGMQIKEALHYIRHNFLSNRYNIKLEISRYSMVKSPDELKYALMVSGPCVAGMPVYQENIYSCFWNGNTFQGGHCITIVGYDKDGFIIRNSWGPQWADKGYILLPYGDFEKFFEIWSLS